MKEKKQQISFKPLFRVLFKLVMRENCIFTYFKMKEINNLKSCSTHMHLRGTATQQINEGWVEGHDGISQMNTVLLLLFLTSKPTNQENVFFYNCFCLAKIQYKQDNTQQCPFVHFSRLGCWVDVGSNSAAWFHHHVHEASVFLHSGSIPCWILRDLDGLLHGSQQTVPALTSQGWAEALRPTDEQTHHNISVLLHALSCEAQVCKC